MTTGTPRPSERLLALGGQVDDADAILAKVERFGGKRAAVLRAQLLLLLDRHHEAGLLICRLLRSDAADFVRDPLFTEEFLPWLRFQDTLPLHNSILRSALIGVKPDLVRALAEDEARTNPPTFGNPEVDALVRQAL